MYTNLGILSLPIISYMIILPSICYNPKMRLLLILTLFLLFSQICFTMFIVFGYMENDTVLNDPSNLKKQ